MFSITCHRCIPRRIVFAATGLRLCWHFYSFTLWTQILPISCSKFHTSYAGDKNKKNRVLNETRLHRVLSECVLNLGNHGASRLGNTCCQLFGPQRWCGQNDSEANQCFIGSTELTLPALKFGIRGLLDWDDQSCYIVYQQDICGTTWFVTALTRADIIQVLEVHKGNGTLQLIKGSTPASSARIWASVYWLVDENEVFGATVGVLLVCLVLLVVGKFFVVYRIRMQNYVPYGNRAC
jgi:hypothetical protein